MASPRIYTYKISFPDQGWWYWGVHKERVHGEFYMGSPITHKAKWDFFYHEKQILEFFDTWEEACEVEKRLIKPDLNNPLCLNENNAGSISLKTASKGGKTRGKILGKRNVESGHLASIQSLGGKAQGKIRGKENVESGLLAKICKEGGKVQGRKNVESGHFHKIRNYRYRCLVTGFVSLAGPLTCYQRARGIDTSLRERVK